MGSKLLKIIAWVAGLLFIIAGISLLSTEGYRLAGLLMLIGAILLLPPIKDLITKRRAELSRSSITAIGSITILVSFFLPQDSDSKVDQITATTSNSLAEEATYSQDDENQTFTSESVDEAVVSMGEEVATNEGFGEYKRIPTQNWEKSIVEAYLKFAADEADDDEFLKFRNIEQYKSQNAFDKKEVLDRVEQIRSETRAYDGPLKIAVDFISIIPIDGKRVAKILDTEYFSVGENSINPVSPYNFENKSFPFNCSFGTDFRINYEAEPNFVKDKYIRLYLNNIKLQGDEGYDQCHFRVEDQGLASMIEEARVNDKTLLTGTNYYTLISPFSDDEDEPNFNAKMDKSTVNLHIINEDGTMSEPLASKTVYRNHKSETFY